MSHTYTRLADLIEYIRDNPGVTSMRIRIHFGMSTYKSSSWYLKKVVDAGLIRTEKIKGDRELRYFVREVANVSAGTLQEKV